MSKIDSIRKDLAALLNERNAAHQKRIDLLAERNRLQGAAKPATIWHPPDELMQQLKEVDATIKGIEDKIGAKQAQLAAALRDYQIDYEADILKRYRADKGRVVRLQAELADIKRKGAAARAELEKTAPEYQCLAVEAMRDNGGRSQFEALRKQRQKHEASLEMADAATLAIKGELVEARQLETEGGLLDRIAEVGRVVDEARKVARGLTLETPDKWRRLGELWNEGHDLLAAMAGYTAPPDRRSLHYSPFEHPATAFARLAQRRYLDLGFRAEDFALADWHRVAENVAAVMFSDEHARRRESISGRARQERIQKVPDPEPEPSPQAA